MCHAHIGQSEDSLCTLCLCSSLTLLWADNRKLDICYKEDFRWKPQSNKIWPRKRATGNQTRSSTQLQNKTSKTKTLMIGEFETEGSHKVIIQSRQTVTN